MAVPELLRKLLTAPGPSGYETAAAAVWREAANGFATVTSDAMGSSVARVPGTSDGPLLVVLGHIDEIGLMVTHIDDEGFVFFMTVGGTRTDVLHGQRVEVATKGGPVPGVIGRKGGKRPKPGEKPEPLELEDLHIDIGANDRAEALGRLQIGDVAVLATQPVELVGGDVAAVAAVQEEVGDFAGARTSVFALDPQVALAVDVTGATDIPDGDPKLDGEAKLGGGPIVNRGSTINPKVFELLVETAEAEGIGYTVNVSAGDTHTDMDAAYTSRAGVATGLISLATRYIHTPGEVVSLDDVDATVRLVAAFAQRLEPGFEFTR